MIEEKIKNRGEEMSVLEGHDRLHYLIDIAKGVEPLSAQEKIDENKIRGCASNLWVVGQVDNGTMFYKHDADAFITKGTAKLVTDLCNGCPRDEIMQLKIEDFIPLGVRELLTMQRQNGLGSLIQRIVDIANTK